MKIIITTSNFYHHLLPIFFYCFNKFMPGYDLVLLGYDIPTCTLPGNVTFVSMGKQGAVNEWSTDIRAYIEANPDVDWWMWLFEDSFLKAPINEESLIIAYALCMQGVGKVALTRDITNRPHAEKDGIIWAAQDSRYRLSTQPAIWAKEYLLQYLSNGMSCWDFETQDPMNDGWQIVSPKEPVIKHNEGVRRKDIHDLDLNGFSQEDVDNIKKLAVWME